jgi:hypothetical protein
MMFLATVQCSFKVAGRGCVIVPDLFGSNVDFRVKAKDHIQLRYRDGRVLDTHIVGVELVCGPDVKNHLAFLLPEAMTQQNIPDGAEIWLTTGPD